MEAFLYQDLYNQENTHWWHLAKRFLVVNLINKYSTFNKPKILDIGCGTGKNIEELSKLGESWGIDFSPKAIKFCKDKGIRNVKLAKSDNTGFPASEFQIVTLLDVLEHVDEEKTLKEIKRLLIKNGLLIITVPAHQWLWSKWDEVLHHKRRYTKNNLQKVLKQNDFKIISISYTYSFLVLPVIIVRSIKSIIFKNNYNSDFEISNPLINKLLLMLAKFEILTLGDKIPTGTSLVCIARNEK